MAYRVLPYREPLALLTDLYEISMAYGYWKSGVDRQEAIFHLIFRENPFKSGFTLACGLESVIDFLENFRFKEPDVRYLQSLNGNDGKPLFHRDFLAYLKKTRLECDLDAVPEGTVVFPQEPLLRIKGPVAQCQMLETAFLNILNFQTLIATKAARVCQAARGDAVIEFGLRRAQGIDGGLSASRAAYIGGCDATSNLLAGKIYGIPVRGTLAHSWVMFFEGEAEAFLAYAKAMPNNSVFLVDTYDTLEGVKRAVEAGKWLKSQGYGMIGIRLDSGDFAKLSVEARKILDEAGFHDAKIVASNELDEHAIRALKERGAVVNVWGVGTKLVTGFDQPALGGVYKLAAVKDKGGRWRRKVKLSEEHYKSSDPGIKQVRRSFSGNQSQADVIYDVELGLKDPCAAVDSADLSAERQVSFGKSFKDLLVPVFRGGKCVYQFPSIHDIRKSAREDLASFSVGVKELKNPGAYFVGFEKSLYRLKGELASTYKVSK